MSSWETATYAMQKERVLWSMDLQIQWVSYPSVDDILIASGDSTSHLESLRQPVQMTRESKLRIAVS
jgi:hypothetical protein